MTTAKHFLIVTIVKSVQKFFPNDSKRVSAMKIWKKYLFLEFDSCHVYFDSLKGAKVTRFFLILIKIDIFCFNNCNC